MKTAWWCSFGAVFLAGVNAYADEPRLVSPTAAYGMDTTARVVVVAPPPPTATQAVDLPPNVRAAQRVTPLRLAATEYLVGLGAAAVTVPLSLALGTYLGSLSNNLVGAALPSLLIFTLVPSFVVTGAEVVAGNMLIPGVASMHPAIWPALATSIASIAAGAVSGVSVRNALSFSLFSLAVSAVLPAGVTLVLHATRPRWVLDARRRVARRTNESPSMRPLASRVDPDARRLEDPYAAQSFSVPLVAGVF